MVEDRSDKTMKMIEPTREEILKAWEVLYKLQHDGRRSEDDVDLLHCAMRILDTEQNRRLNNGTDNTTAAGLL